jgi:hypothetical protein
MTRRLAAARLVITAVLSAASPACAGPGLSAAAVHAPAPRAIGIGGERVQAAVTSGASTTVLDINGSGEIRLHNRFLVGGLLLYVAVMVGALVFLEKRRVAAAVILGAGLIAGGLLLARAFG